MDRKERENKNRNTETAMPKEEQRELNVKLRKTAEGIQIDGKGQIKKQ